MQPPTDPRMKARRIHELKTYPDPYWLIAQGYKTFEYRKNDRGYLASDLLHLREWNPELEAFTGFDSWYEVIYVLRGSDAPEAYGIPKDHCIMSIRPIDREATDALYYMP